MLARSTRTGATRCSPGARTAATGSTSACRARARRCSSRLSRTGRRRAARQRARRCARGSSRRSAGARPSRPAARRRGRRGRTAAAARSRRPSRPGRRAAPTTARGTIVSCSQKTLRYGQRMSLRRTSPRPNGITPASSALSPDQDVHRLAERRARERHLVARPAVHRQEALDPVVVPEVLQQVDLLDDPVRRLERLEALVHRGRGHEPGVVDHVVGIEPAREEHLAHEAHLAVVARASSA